MNDNEILDVGTKLGVDFTVIPKEEFIAGYKDELEHSDVTGGDPTATAKIALVHLKEDPHYYSKLKQALEGKSMKYAPQAVKFIDEENGLIGFLGLPYGGPFAGNKDLEGEDFGPDTNFHEDWFERRPILYHHGLDPDVGDNPVGVQTSMKTVEAGRWVEGQLDKSNKYWEGLRTLIKAGKLYASSHCPPHLKQATKGGHITNWPVVEFTLTPTPANPYATIESFKALKDLESIGITTDKLKEATKMTEEKKPEIPAEKPAEAAPEAKCAEKCDAKKDEMSLSGNVVKAALALHEALEGLIPGICEMAELTESDEEQATEGEPVPGTTEPGVSQGMGAEEKVTKSTKSVKEPVDAMKALKAFADEQDKKLEAAVKAAVTPLKEQLDKVLATPVTEGIVRSVAKSVNPKMGGDGVDTATKAAVLQELIDSEQDPSLKQALGNRAALLGMKDVINSGMQPIRNERK